MVMSSEVWGTPVGWGDRYGSLETDGQVDGETETNNEGRKTVRARMKDLKPRPTVPVSRNNNSRPCPSTRCPPHLQLFLPVPTPSTLSPSMSLSQPTSQPTRVTGRGSVVAVCSIVEGEIERTAN
ncbi:hypothetical protein PoB_006515000 [Plakobranchus ocellatus]|uniref:Uncharacterized protein n=1 Tax=Plakobranchus ocellatus TaxID=259542 RepID=A0AAV4D3H1_9GAST|nr:hypothetical protein PoB_006515000 [Plakobranchus ocellatus]